MLKSRSKAIEPALIVLSVLFALFFSCDAALAMFCSKCGKSVSDEARFCKFCGFKVAETDGDKPADQAKPAVEDKKTDGAYDYSRIIPENTGAIVKVNIKSIFESALPNPFGEGASRKIQDEFRAEFEKRTGLSLKKDIKEVLLCLRSGIDINARYPNNLVVFLTGNFNVEKLTAEIEKEKALPLKIVTEKGRKIFENPVYRIVFVDNETLALGSRDVIAEILEGKYKTAGLSGDLKENFEKSNIFIHFSVGTPESSTMRILVTELAKNFNPPPAAGDIIKKINSFTAFDRLPQVIVNADLADRNAAADVETMFITLKTLAKNELESEEKKVLEKMKNASTFEMLMPEIYGVRTIIALGNELVDAFEFKANERSVTLKFSVPPFYKNIFTSYSVPAAAALVSLVLPRFAAMTMDAKNEKAKQDCETLVMCVQKYNSLEGAAVQDRFMAELQGKYVTNLNTLKDPWANRYEHDPQKGIIYSKGPDGEHDPEAGQGSGVNADDIAVSYK